MVTYEKVEDITLANKTVELYKITNLETNESYKTTFENDYEVKKCVEVINNRLKNMVNMFLQEGDTEE